MHPLHPCTSAPPVDLDPNRWSLPPKEAEPLPKDVPIEQQVKTTQRFFVSATPVFVKDEFMAAHLPSLLAAPLAQSVRQVQLTRTGLGDQGTIALASALSGNRRVREVNIEANCITAMGINALAGVLAMDDCVVEILRLDDNELGAAGAVTIARALVTNTTLRNLSLNSNGVGDEGGKGMVPLLKTNRSVISLALALNNISMAISDDLEDALLTGLSPADQTRVDFSC